MYIQETKKNCDGFLLHEENVPEGGQAPSLRLKSSKAISPRYPEPLTPSKTTYNIQKKKKKNSIEEEHFAERQYFHASNFYVQFFSTRNNLSLHNFYKKLKLQKNNFNLKLYLLGNLMLMKYQLLRVAILVPMFLTFAIVNS